MSIKKLQVFAERFMPDFVHRDHEVFTKFIKYYFELLEQTDGVYDYAANALEYMDIDGTKDHILEEFRNTYLLNFPEGEVDVRFLVKHIREFYKSKGSEKSYEFLFRLLYGDDDIDLYYPKLDILRCSDGKWDDTAQDWKNTDGFLSDDKKLQDNYYYQDFSYEIIADVTRFYYENVVKENLHVSGELMFGRNILANDVPLDVGWIDYDKYDRLKATDVGEVLLWDGTPYTVSTAEQNDHTVLVDVNGLKENDTVEYPFVSIQGSYTDGDVISMRRLGHSIGDNESFSGNGVLDTFTLDGSYTGNQLMVWVDKVKMYNTIDFTISGTDIIFTTPPATGTNNIEVLKHTMSNVELISGVGTNKYITLANDPQGYLLNKIIIFFNGVITAPDYYDPLTKRVYFEDYVAEGTNNIEVIHMESLGYYDSVVLDGITTKMNIAANKNKFLHLPESPYVVLIQPLDTPTVGITDGMLTLNVYITRPDAPTLSLIERTYILLKWQPTDINIMTNVPDGGTGFNYSDNDPLHDTLVTTRNRQNIGSNDVSFDDTGSYTINSTSLDFSVFVADDVITVSTTSGINNGDYTVISATANTITVTEALSAASAGAVGTTTISRDGLFDAVNASDWITISGSTSNDGTYLVESAEDDTLTLAYNYGFTDETNDTSGVITVDREQVQDRLYTKLGEVLLVTLLWDVADDVLIDPDMDATTPTIFANTSATDSVLIDPDMDATPTIAGTISSRSDSVLIDPDMDATPSVTQTSSGTDIGFTATSTIYSTTTDLSLFDDTDSITITSTSGTNDGTYTISGTPTATSITISETTLTTEAPATAGTVTISRTV